MDGSFLPRKDGPRTGTNPEEVKELETPLYALLKHTASLFYVFNPLKDGQILSRGSCCVSCHVFSQLPRKKVWSWPDIECMALNGIPCRISDVPMASEMSPQYYEMMRSMFHLLHPTWKPRITHQETWTRHVA